MIKFNVKVDDSATRRALKNLQDNLQDKVLRQAINKVAEKARAEINRAIPEEFAVKASEVRNAINLRKARSGNLEAVIEIFGSARKRGRSLNLIHFLAAVRGLAVRGKRAKKKDLAALDQQIGFLIKKAGGLKHIEGAFIGNKGRTVFRRTGKGRLPIEPVQVIGFSQMFTSRRISKRVMAKINTEMPVEIGRALNLLMGRR
ncbi:MAG: hypothetical protein C3F19_11620 [Rhodocyclales bacterium]|jgi:hypothetical protein|nr:MAG: hypothetical protein C3F19_11620 [Rhodocyclales bacterium]